MLFILLVSIETKPYYKLPLCKLYDRWLGVFSCISSMQCGSHSIFQVITDIYAPPQKLDYFLVMTHSEIAESLSLIRKLFQFKKNELSAILT